MPSIWKAFTFDYHTLRFVLRLICSFLVQIWAISPTTVLGIQKIDWLKMLQFEKLDWSVHGLNTEHSIYRQLLLFEFSNGQVFGTSQKSSNLCGLYNKAEHLPSNNFRQGHFLLWGCEVCWQISWLHQLCHTDQVVHGRNLHLRVRGLGRVNQESGNVKMTID